MPAIEQNAVKTHGSRRRLPFPILWLIFISLLVVVNWIIPIEGFDFGYRVVGTMFAAAFTIIALSVWLVFFSPLVWQQRSTAALALLASFGVVLVVVRRVEFSGDMIPSVDWRWNESRDDILEAHRAQAVASDAPQTVDLSVVSSADVTEFRGAGRKGVYEGPPLDLQFASAPETLWRQPVGGGYAAFDIVGTAAITMEQRGPNEAIVCYDAQTGKEIWIHSYPALFSETLGGDGPRTTPTVYKGNVYALGATGHLVCLDGATGKEIWHADILGENQAKNLDWGMSASPLVIDHKVIVNPGVRDASQDAGAVIAYDADSGAILWKAGKAAASYSSPMAVELLGKQQILLFDGGGLAGLDPADGDELWRYPWKTQYDINAAQPIVVDGSRIFLSSQTGCALVELEKKDGQFQAETLWTNRWMKCHYSSPILVGKYLYGLDGGILVCLDLDTGKRQWKKGRYGHGQMMRDGDNLIILGEQGELAVVAADPKEFREIARFQALAEKTWNPPTIANGILYARNHLEMAAYDLRAETTPASPAP